MPRLLQRLSKGADPAGPTPLLVAQLRFGGRRWLITGADHHVVNIGVPSAALVKGP